MGKVKKEIPEAEMLEKPSHKFCEMCKNTDVRLVKDTANLAVMTINNLEYLLGTGGNSLSTKCEKLTKWVRDYTTPNKRKTNV